MNNKKKFLVGKIKSLKMQKTAVVSVEILKKHPMYGKTIKKTASFKAHIPEGLKLEIGEKVNLLPTRPLSKEKRLVVKKIVL